MVVGGWGTGGRGCEVEGARPPRIVHPSLAPFPRAHLQQKNGPHLLGAGVQTGETIPQGVEDAAHGGPRPGVGGVARNEWEECTCFLLALVTATTEEKKMGRSDKKKKKRSKEYSGSKRDRRRSRSPTPSTSGSEDEEARRAAKAARLVRQRAGRERRRRHGRPLRRGRRRTRPAGAHLLGVGGD